MCVYLRACVCYDMRMETPTLFTSRPSRVGVWMLLIMVAANSDSLSINIRALIQLADCWYEHRLSGYLCWEYHGI